MRTVPWKILLAGVGALAALATGGAAERFTLVWPTPNTAWTENKPPSEWLQHAGSGDPATGGFGGVRSGGTRFHEGIDIRPAARDRKGEPLDAVLAAMAGVVRHVSSAPGNSGYGRYVVLEHPAMTPAVYTLYAHLARIEPGMRIGTAVNAGQTLGTMGHSSGGYMIPVARSHLHFEIGVAVTRDFQAWYERRRFGSRNDHGMWNGMNLLGIDPLAFYNEWRTGRLTHVQDFFNGLETAVRWRIATYRRPDFVTRYPSLITKPLPLGPVAGWEVRCTWTGLPFAWTPLTTAEVAGLPPEKAQVVEVNEAIVRRERSKSLAVARGGTWTVGKDLELILQQLFGLR
jgi:murein DD-endopeptidase MepM/ murein hydrolase activator NlpD